jgi:hypothetical protein
MEAFDKTFFFFLHCGSIKVQDNSVLKYIIILKKSSDKKKKKRDIFNERKKMSLKRRW